MQNLKRIWPLWLQALVLVLVLIASTANAALGAFINTNFPGVLAANELTPPVAYTIVFGRVVLDLAAKYPTEK